LGFFFILFVEVHCWFTAADYKTDSKVDQPVLQIPVMLQQSDHICIWLYMTHTLPVMLLTFQDIPFH
jgi:hypothetical protein